MNNSSCKKEMLDNNQQKLVNIPAFQPSYDALDHTRAPHIVKFSGGRSSAMMLFILLENGILNAKRGDVIIFNNTSAEHLATYEFAAKCKIMAEKYYGIPFYWIEYQTYEVASGGEWTRRSSYKLVNSNPFSNENPNGYHHKGEIFEELISWLGFLPSRHQRICTSHLKINTTNYFLEDWFALKPNIDRLGHNYENSQITGDDIYRRHQQHRGMSDRESYLGKKEFVRNCSLYRPKQYFADFSGVKDCKIVNDELSKRTFGNIADLHGEDPIEFLAFIGLRGDEPNRVSRMQHRNSLSPSSKDRSISGHTGGEYVYFPLARLDLDKNAIFKFWESQTWNLTIPIDYDFSNCVYCFMKGANRLKENHINQNKVESEMPAGFRNRNDEPSNIAWWAKIEEKYSRIARRKGNGNTKDINISFFGADADMTYRKIIDDNIDTASGMTGELPCHCTD